MPHQLIISPHSGPSGENSVGWALCKSPWESLSPGRTVWGVVYNVMSERGSRWPRAASRGPNAHVRIAELFRGRLCRKGRRAGCFSDYRTPPSRIVLSHAEWSLYFFQQLYESIWRVVAQASLFFLVCSCYWRVICSTRKQLKHTRATRIFFPTEGGRGLGYAGDGLGPYRGRRLHVGVQGAVPGTLSSEPANWHHSLLGTKAQGL